MISGFSFTKIIISNNLDLFILLQAKPLNLSIVKIKQCLHAPPNASRSKRKKSARPALFRHNDVYQTALHKMKNIGLKTY